MQMKSQKIQINVYKVTMLVGGSIFSTIFNKIALLFPFILLMGYGLSVQAAEEAKAPDAGQILQQIERDIKVKPLQTIPEVPAESTPAPIRYSTHLRQQRIHDHWFGKYRYCFSGDVAASWQ